LSACAKDCKPRTAEEEQAEDRKGVSAQKPSKKIVNRHIEQDLQHLFSVGYIYTPKRKLNTCFA
jgi:hypothetical protein